MPKPSVRIIVPRWSRIRDLGRKRDSRTQTILVLLLHIRSKDVRRRRDNVRRMRRNDLCSKHFRNKLLSGCSIARDTVASKTRRAREEVPRSSFTNDLLLIRKINPTRVIQLANLVDSGHHYLCQEIGSRTSTSSATGDIIVPVQRVDGIRKPQLHGHGVERVPQGTMCQANNTGRSALFVKLVRCNQIVIHAFSATNFVFYLASRPSSRPQTARPGTLRQVSEEYAKTSLSHQDPSG